MNEVYLGLGANLGDPVANLLSARTKIEQLNTVSLVAQSPLYLSAPLGYAEQNDFINAVVRCEVVGDALNLLQDLQGIEHELGRKRDARNQNAPRSIDVDILLFGEQAVNSQVLEIPHPRMFDRLFVLLPLLDVLSSSHPLAQRVQNRAQVLQKEAQQSLHQLTC